MTYKLKNNPEKLSQEIARDNIAFGLLFSSIYTYELTRIFLPIQNCHCFLYTVFIELSVLF